jgi:hypothetical protein
MKVKLLRLDAQLQKFEFALPVSWVYAAAISVLFVLYVLFTLLAIDPTRVTDSSNRTDVTVVHDKYQCVRVMFPIHMTFCWCMFLAGLLAIVFRFASFWPSLNAWWVALFRLMHRWAGRFYIIFMLWTIATSSLIRNEGLPLGTLTSFISVLGGVTFGFLMIMVDSNNVWSRITHGSLMATSWVGVAGRITNYNLHKDFQCYAQPAYKANATLIPSEDLAYHKMPWADIEVWGWGASLAYVPFVVSVFIGWLSLVYCTRKQ